MTTKQGRPRIALLVNFLDSAYQMSLRAAVTRAAAIRGVDLFIAVGRELGHEDVNERALNSVYDWLSPSSVDGAILVAGSLVNYVGSEGIAALCRRLAPVESCSIGLSLPGIRSIFIDNRAAMRVAVEHLIRHHGCRRVAYIGGPSNNDEAAQRLAGYADALRDAGLPDDPDLIGTGNFSTPRGREAMLEILGRSRDVDAVVAANDYMAIGALEALEKAGLRVPEDMLVMGFDDAPVARFARRSLSTVAQPIEEMAERALDSVLHKAAGGAELTQLDVHLVLRESCGCGYALGNTSRHNAPSIPTSAVTFLRERGELLAARVLEQSGSSRTLWSSFVPELIAALADDIDGQPGAFPRSAESIAERLMARDVSLDEAGRALVQLRRSCREAGYHGSGHIGLEEACMKGLAVLSSVATRCEGRRALNVMDRAYGLRQVTQGLSTALNRQGVAKNFRHALSDMGIQTGLLCVTSSQPARLESLMAVQAGEELVVESGAFPVAQLFPRGFPKPGVPACLLVWPLTFEKKVLGLVAFDGHADAFVCEAVRSQLGAALELGALHARVVEETALRERLAHEQLLGELAVARRIQTALVPKHVTVSGLQLAHGMVPADQVGGDYYDVFNTSDGCWIGIGDVTGHGLLAGMIMLMIQSAVGGLVSALPDATPRDIVVNLNRVVRMNIRERMGGEDHATFLMVRYSGDGRLTFAGAHEEVLIYRAAGRRCEVLPTQGVWIGIGEDISAETPDQTSWLHPGDVMVLYTDGLIEARSANGEEFGLERVQDIVVAAAEEPVGDIYERLLAAVRAWTPVQQDDVTLVVARRVPT